LLSQDRDHLRVVYDAQLKKMLAYIAIMLTSFAAQLALLFVAVGRSAWSPNISVSNFKILAFVLWLSQLCLVLAIATKFQELVILENELGFRVTYDEMIKHKFILARFWAKAFGVFFRIRGTEYKRMNIPFTVVTVILLIIITAVFCWVLGALC
jgi:hypothetical protein